MIVACPSCQTKYNLPEDKVPEKGLKVKCSKCEHVFKVTPPPATPEDEVEMMLDDNATAPEGSAAPPATDSDFDAAYDEAIAGGPGEDAPDDDIVPPSVEDDPLLEGFGDEDLGGLDDDAGEDDFGAGLTEDADSDLGGDLAQDDDDDLFGGFGDDDDAADSTPQFEAPDDTDMNLDAFAKGDDFGLGSDDEEEDFGISDDDDEEEDSVSFGDDDDFDDEKREDLFQSLAGDNDLDIEPKKSSGGGFGRFLVTLFLLLILIAGSAVVTYNFGLWSLPDSMKAMSMEAPFELPFKVPFLKSPGEPDAPEPGTSPSKNVEEIKPVDFRQYVITNEHSGAVFVVEGKAKNDFAEAKERIKVRVTLFDAQGKELATQDQMCGNTLSLLQLQVQTKDEVLESLNSTAGIYANNSFIKPQQTTPFMVVFFDPPEKVHEYQIEVIDARDPKR